MNITDVSIRNPVFAWMLMACTILFGIVAATRIGISQYPDVDYPNITVSLSWPGAAPSAIEREVLDPLEQALAQVEGIQQISSQARQNSARLTATFDLSRDVDLALQDVQAKVAQAQRSLPKDVPAATVSKSNPDDTPILTVGIQAHFHGKCWPTWRATKCRRRFKRCPGSGRSRSTGISIATCASGSIRAGSRSTASSPPT